MVYFIRVCKSPVRTLIESFKALRAVLIVICIGQRAPIQRQLRQILSRVTHALAVINYLRQLFAPLYNSLSN
jgi:hypothetical protein